MVTDRSASPEPEVTVIDIEREVPDPRPGRQHRPHAAVPRPGAVGCGFTGAGGGSGSLLRRVRAVSFEASSLVDNFASYKASGPPSRVLYYGGAGAWADFTGEALACLRREFEAGRTSVELVGAPEVGGKASEAAVVSVVDFLRMLHTDLGSGKERSVAWIDVHGRCFFPKRVVGGAEDGNGWDGSKTLEIDVVGNLFPDSPPRLPGHSVPFGKAAAVVASPAPSGSQEEQSNETPAAADIFSVSANPAGNRVKAELLTPRWDDGGAVEPVDRAADYFKHVERVFLSGVRRVSPDAAVTAVRRCTHAGAHGAARLRAFVTQAQFTKAVRGGDANVRAAWYPASAPDDVDEVVRHGFAATNCDKFGESRYGTGVYLIPPQSMHLHPRSYVLPEPDANGERHLLLCRAIAGSVERVGLGSDQSHPGSDRFDTGADDPDNPKIHIIWNAKMNTHVIPECVVSFRCPSLVAPLATPTRKPVPARRPPHSIPLTFLQLFAEIRKFVPPATMRTLDALLERYKARKIPKDVFIRHLRSVAGTGVLAETIRKFKDRV